MILWISPSRKSRAKWSIGSNDIFDRSCSLGLEDSRVRYLRTDVRNLLTEKFHAIILDVDNGPEPISDKDNAWLYSQSGLLEIRRHLEEDGALLVWSSFRSKEFAEVVRQVGFTCSEMAIDVGHRDHQHYIYVCKNDGIS